MDDDQARLVRDIRARAATIESFIAGYESVSNLRTMPLEAKGRIWFLAPDSFRAETRVCGRQIIILRKGSAIRRRILERNEVWKYDLSDLPESLPINAGIADLRDPFFAADVESLRYEGKRELGNATVHAFAGAYRNRARAGLLDTRKGFSIRYQPADLGVRVALAIDLETGLLRRIAGEDGARNVLFRVDYLVEAVNVTLDEGLFGTEEPDVGYRLVDITDILLSSLNPDAAEAPPSPN